MDTGGWLLASVVLLGKATVMLVVASLLAAALRDASARLRHVFWSLTFASLLGLPALPLVVPTWEIPWLAKRETPGFAARPEVVPETPRAAGPGALRPGTDGAPATPLPGTSLRLPEFDELILAGWASGALLLLGGLAAGVCRVERIARQARPGDDGWRRCLAESCAQLGIRRRVRLRLSPRVGTPLAGGCLRPLVLLPPEAESWSVERRRIVLLHELLHIAHHDWIAGLLAQAARALYWFHPLVWLAVRRAEALREEACDQSVVARGLRPSEYATHILEIGDALRPFTPAGALAMTSRTTQLERRIMSILRNTPPKRRLGFAGAAVTILLATVVSLAAAEPGGNSTAVTAATLPSAAVAASSLGEDPCAPDSEFSAGSMTWISGSSQGERAVKRRFDDMTLCIHTREDVEIDAAGRIGALPPGAFVTVRVEADATQLGVDLTVGADGNRTYRYTHNGVEKTFDPEAQRFLEAALAAGHDLWEIGKIRGEVGGLRGEIGGIRGQVGGLRGKIGGIRGQRGSLRGQIGGLRGKIGGLRGEIGGVRGKIGGLQGRKAGLDRRDADDREEIEEIDAEIARLREEEERLEEKLELWEAETETAIAELEAKIAELDVEGRIEGIEKEIEALDAPARIAKLEEEIEGLHADDRIEALEKKLEPKYKSLREIVGQMAS